MKLRTYMITGGIASLAGLALLSKQTPKSRHGATVRVPTRLEPGDHVWFWNGNIASNEDIPQEAWFGTTAPGDYAGHGKEIFYYVVLDNEVRRGRPHMRGLEGSFAWMHNNPGNIMGPQANIGQYQGKFGWHHFMIFPTFQLGFNAIAKYLRTNPIYQGLSILQAFNRYAPKSDGNEPDKYAAEVANAAGVNVNDPIVSLNDDQMRLVQEKITQVEGLVPGVSLSFGSAELPSAIRNLFSQV